MIKQKLDFVNVWRLRLQKIKDQNHILKMKGN